MATHSMRYGAFGLIAGFALALSGATTFAADATRLAGGPKGIVKSTTGELLEGVMVQLIANKTAIRTTVYSDAGGHYEFPALACRHLHAAHCAPARISPLCAGRRRHQWRVAARRHFPRIRHRP